MPEQIQFSPELVSLEMLEKILKLFEDERKYRLQQMRVVDEKELPVTSKFYNEAVGVIYQLESYLGKPVTL